MICRIYPLFKNGVKLPREEARAREVQADLEVQAGPRGLVAFAQIPDRVTHLLPELSEVRLVQVKGRGFCLAGVEHLYAHWGNGSHKQAWWCVPG